MACDITGREIARVTVSFTGSTQSRPTDRMASQRPWLVAALADLLTLAYSLAAVSAYAVAVPLDRCRVGDIAGRDL